MIRKKLMQINKGICMTTHDPMMTVLARHGKDHAKTTATGLRVVHTKARSNASPARAPAIAAAK